MELFVKLVNSWKPLASAANGSISDVVMGLDTSLCFYRTHFTFHLAQGDTISTCRKLLCLSAGKKSTSSPPMLAFLENGKDMQTYFGYFRHAWLHTPKVIVSACRRLR